MRKEKAEYRLEPIENVIPTPDNRRHFKGPDDKNERLCELAESIREDGVLEPLLCREHPTVPGKLDLRAGERRLRAARLAGLTVVPVIVRPMTDEQALRVTTVENLQREDLTPLESAGSIQLLAERGWTLERIADELGSSVKWVARRLSLTKLIDGWRELLEDRLSSWTVRQMEFIARMPEAAQAQALATVNRCLESTYNNPASWNWEVLKDYVGFDTPLLSCAKWKLDDATLVPVQGPCTECLRRSDVQPELFDDEDFEQHGSKKGTSAGVLCLDSECWSSKERAWIQRRTDELKAKHANLVTVDQTWNLNRVKKGAPGAVPVLIVKEDSPEFGRLVWAIDAQASGKGAGKKPPEEMTAKEKAQALKEKRANLTVLRSRIIAQKILERIDEWIKSETVPSPVQELEMLALATVFGVSLDQLGWFGRKQQWGKWREYRKADWRELSRKLLFAAMRHLARNLREAVQETQFSKAAVDSGYLKDTCTFLGLDYEELQREAAVEKPEPKSWAKLEGKAV